MLCPHTQLAGLACRSEESTYATEQLPSGTKSTSGGERAREESSCLKKRHEKRHGKKLHIESAFLYFELQTIPKHTVVAKLLVGIKKRSGPPIIFGPTLLSGKSKHLFYVLRLSTTGARKQFI